MKQRLSLLLGTALATASYAFAQGSPTFTHRFDWCSSASIFCSTRETLKHEFGQRTHRLEVDIRAKEVSRRPSGLDGNELTYEVRLTNDSPCTLFVANNYLKHGSKQNVWTLQNIEIDPGRQVRFDDENFIFDENELNPVRVTITGVYSDCD